MSATTLSNFLYQLNEYWLAGGMPAETYGKAGTLYKMIGDQFGINADWQGDGTAKHPVRRGLNGAIGNNFAKSFSHSVPSSGEQFLVPNARHWAHMIIDDRALAFTRSPSAMRSALSGQMDEMEQTVEGWMRATSYLLWDDGRHLLAKGDANYNVALTTLVFRNVDNRNKFEIGDIIRLVPIAAAAAAAPGTLPAPRVGTLTVSKVLSNGLEVTAAINTVVGADNTDFVSKDVYFDSAKPADNVPFTGVFGYLAENETLANSTFNDVDRSVNPTRLAGLRVNLTGAETPWDICSKMMTTVETDGAMLDVIYIPTSQVAALMQEMGSRNVTYRAVEIPVKQAQNLVIGVTATEVVYGSQRAYIMSDRFLSDPTVSAADDTRYVGLYSSNCKVISADGASWKDYDGDGARLSQVGVTEDYAAQYGVFGQYTYDNPLNAIVAKVGANL